MSSERHSPIDGARARELLSRERERIERSLADSARNRASEVAGLDQHPADDAGRLQEDEVDQALDEHFREDLAAVERAERRLEEGTYGLSIESGEPIPPHGSRRSPGPSAPRRSRSATSAGADELQPRLRVRRFRHDPLRTCVRVARAHDPARRPGRVLCLGRAARRSSPPRSAGDRRGGGGARSQLRGQGLRRSDGDGWRAGASAVPAGGGRAAADVGVRRGEQGGVRGVRARRRRWSRGSRSTRRSSTFAGSSGSRARPPRSPRGCGARSASASASRSRSGWPAPSSSPRWRAGWPSPTGCWWCRPAASSAFSTRSRWNGCGAWAR